MAARPAVWQRLPDIVPNYSQLERRAKAISGSKSREAAVILRENASSSHQLTAQLSTLTVEKLRTVRLWNTTKQSFIARQSAKQRHLEQAGVTDVSLLPPHLMLLTTPAQAAEMAMKSRDAFQRRRDNIRRKLTEAAALNTNMANDCDAPAETGNQTIEGRENNNASIRDVDVASDPMKKTLTTTESIHRLTTPSEIAEDKTISTFSPFLTHNYVDGIDGSLKNREKVQQQLPPSPSFTNERVDVPSAMISKQPISILVRRPVRPPTVPGGQGFRCPSSQDRRFLSLLDSLSTCARSPRGGVDAYLQLSPSGSYVLGKYASQSNDIDRVRKIARATGSSARLRHGRRAMTATSGPGERMLDRARYQQSGDLPSIGTTGIGTRDGVMVRARTVLQADHVTSSPRNTIIERLRRPLLSEDSTGDSETSELLE